MNKKKCPQCKNLISLAAPTCLYCGRPNKFVTKDYVNKKWNKEQKNKINFYKILRFQYLFLMFFIVVIIFILFN